MRKAPLSHDEAEAIAFKALAFLAEEPQRLQRFLGLTGIGIDELRTRAGSAATQAAVLDHLLADESLLLVFAANAALAPERVAAAARLVSAGSEDGRDG